jgi:SAM-dependent MidA family methyltransferase
VTPLGREIRELIAAEGPITAERYMALALGHPRHGYYMTRHPFGADGDFTTAPEISQMFGELLGLWAAETWSAMGRPRPLRLVELGPGRGTLMADALRAARVLPGFRDAVTVHLVETSPALREAQALTLADSGVEPAWHARVDELPPGPAIVVANEFFDALPIRQFVRAEDGWRERVVGLGPDGELAFGLAPDPDSRLAVPGRAGDILEVGEAGLALVRDLATRLVREGGAALVVDYGHLRSGTGDTLQALRRHAFADPLAEPGEADLTAHVDFAALGRAAAKAGATVHGPATQGDFLLALGIEARAERLARGVVPNTGGVKAALRRLTGSGPGEMGALFKVLAFSDPRIASLPGLARSAATLPKEHAPT